jgi:hypothetical protein
MVQSPLQVLGHELAPKLPKETLGQRFNSSHLNTTHLFSSLLYSFILFLGTR